MKALNNRIVVGVVGCGYWGPNLIRNLGQLADCHLKVICDASEKRLSHMQRLHPGVDSTSRFEDLLYDAEIQAVVVATPKVGSSPNTMVVGFPPVIAFKVLYSVTVGFRV